ncbi:patatin-like phospholipase family protein [Rhodospira trueperi]|uniref:Patatin-like phospholipase n=1 Tax=Rhodospira trueperi TaxID=69960 RepID=A0A1G7I0V2_9PROT|nr:patatin-like phospholipase family protein [Rhodospira trueperi]SDF06203.1 Patatin-like phospholipase [Rhodospira trueperi]
MSNTTDPSDRDRHLFGPGPKRMLALDGGAVRGIVSVAFLERMEAMLAARSDDPDGFRLSHYFDLIGGTSTGALIATGLALGLKVDHLRRFYTERTRKIFRRSRFRIAGVQLLFDAKPLVEEILAEVGDRTLDSPDLKTGLVIVTSRMDTGSPWIVTNIPGTKYWDTRTERGTLGNRYYRLASLLRASTAAPYYFKPEPIAVVEGQPPGWFVDGGVSPYNNPSLAMLQAATLSAYGLRWTPGAQTLLLVSVGTGSHRRRVPGEQIGRMSALGVAMRALSGVIADNQRMTLALLQVLSTPADPWPVNNEVGDLSDDLLGGRALLSFQRYDVQFDPSWVAEHTGITISDDEAKAFERLDNAAAVDSAYRIAGAAAERQVRAAHFPPAFDGVCKDSGEGCVAPV